MKQIEQTVPDPPLGNCFAACIASILEVPLADVPQPEEEEEFDHYYDRINDYLKRFSLYLQDFSVANAEGERWTPPGYAIVSVNSPRGDWLHSVVIRDGEIVWDPHPMRNMGTGKWKVYSIFISTDPASMWRYML